MARMNQRPSRLAWLVWGTALLCYVIAVVNRTSFSAIGTQAQVHFGIEATALSVFIVLQLIVYAGAQVPVGILLDRFGPTVMICSGAVLMLSGQTVMALTEHLGVAFFARVLIGAGDACTFISVMRILGDWFPIKILPTMTQLTGQFGYLGQIISVIPLAGAVNRFGWSTAFLGVVAAGGFVLLCAVLVLRDGPQAQTLAARALHRDRAAVAQPEHTESFTGSITLPGGQQLGVLGSIGYVLRRPGVRLAFWVHWTTCLSTHVFVLLWGKPFLVGGEGVSSATAGGMLASAVLLSIVTGLTLGPITSKYAAQRMWVVIGVSIALVLVWAALLLWPGQAPFWMLVLLLTVVTIGGPASMIAFDVVRTHTPLKQIGLATGLANMGGFTGALIAMFGIGLILDLLGAGTPETYSTPAFKVAMAWQIPLLLLGLAMMLLEWPRAKRAYLAERSA